jgi:hypothetical protein
MSYNAKIYRKQGGNEMVVASGGTLTVESGGAVAISGTISIASGGSIAGPVQTLSSTQTATNVTNYGLSVLTGTSTSPTYTLAAPVVGVPKHISLSASSSAAAAGCKLNSNTTGVSFDTTGGNQLTFTTTSLKGVVLVAQSTSKWRIASAYHSAASYGGVRTT